MGSGSSLESVASSEPFVALIAGPTASGKSALALDLAERIGGTLVNADASQVYADLPILSARPDAAEMARAPHCLFGHIDGAEACSAARWAGEARAAIARIHAAGSVPILVGGTGLYFDTLLHGIAPVPEIDEGVRQTVRALPVAQAYEALMREDREAAARLNPGDSARVARALEVVRSTGRPIGFWQQARTGGLIGTMQVLGAVVLRPRAELAERATTRLQGMMAAGALDEVARLCARNLPDTLPVMRALGVRELAACLANALSRDEALARTAAATIAYQKRQMTWARNRQASWSRIELRDSIGLEDFARLG